MKLTHRIRWRRRDERRRAWLVKRDGRACFYCGEEMPPYDRTLEHLVPLSWGGPDNLANLCLAHAACNRRAGILSFVEKIELRERMRAGLCRAGARGGDLRPGARGPQDAGPLLRS